MGKCLTLQGLHASFQHLTYLYRLENRKAGLLGGGGPRFGLENRYTLQNEHGSPDVLIGFFTLKIIFQPNLHDFGFHVTTLVYAD